MTTNPPATPPRAGYYWEYTDGMGWRQVRPMNHWQLRQYYARKAKEHANQG